MSEQRRSGTHKRFCGRSVFQYQRIGFPFWLTLGPSTDRPFAGGQMLSLLLVPLLFVLPLLHLLLTTR